MLTEEILLKLSDHISSLLLLKSLKLLLLAQHKKGLSRGDLAAVAVIQSWMTAFYLTRIWISKMLYVW